MGITGSAVGPGKCQVCGEFRELVQYWPHTLPARFVEVCEHCTKMGDMDMARALPFKFRGGAVV